RGERRHLNLGHTVGHALEAAVGGGLTHGACVAVGLIFATLLAEETGYADPGYAAQVRSLALPLIPPGLAIPPWPVLESLIAHDKKMTADGAIRWVLPVGPGEVSVVAGLPERALAAGWTRLPGALTPASSGAGA
ncbi:MAG TPA: 3-dehydroquinate synthase, partial [bacterium]|nr:3-dehydroquinate synthase [bacterium]